MRVLCLLFALMSAVLAADTRSLVCNTCGPDPNGNPIFYKLP